MRADLIAMAGSLTPKVVTLSYAATIATDATLGNHFRVTLTGSPTLGNPTGAVDGQTFRWEFLQDGTGSRALTLDTKFVVPNNLPVIALTVAANHYSALFAFYNSSLDKFIVAGFLQDYS
jgi:hypothetical protein